MKGWFIWGRLMWMVVVRVRGVRRSEEEGKDCNE